MRYPDHATYEALYARYFKRGPEALIGTEEFPSNREFRVLDLCGGGGRLSIRAHELGARVVYVDQETDMIPREEFFTRGIEFICRPVNEAMRTIQREPERYGPDFDIIACQQGINYWFCSQALMQVRDLLRLGGKFVFNTFNTDPGTTPRVKEYDLDGHHYVEVSYRVGEMIHHVQSRDGLPPHMTEFLWISPEEFQRKLGYYFNAVETVDGPTSIWTCTSK